MEIHRLRSFVTVADAGGVSKAARLLHLAQPAVSQHLKALEHELGVTLFERGSRGMRLTDAGLALLGHARLVLADLAQFRSAADQFHGEQNNQVPIAMTPSLASSLLPAMLEMLLAAPSRVRLVVFERPTEDSLSLLAGGSVNLAVVRDAEGTGFHTSALFEERMYLCVQRGHPLLASDTPALADFHDEPFVFFRHTGREALYLGAFTACQRAGFTPESICEGAEATSLGELVAAGVGVTIAPYSVLRLWRSSDIVTVSLDDPAPRSVAVLAQVQDRVLSPPASQVVKAILRAARLFIQGIAEFEFDGTVAGLPVPRAALG